MSIRKTSQLHQLETENDRLQKAVVELKREPSRTRQSSRKSASALKQASVWMSADEGSECAKTTNANPQGNRFRRLGVEVESNQGELRVGNNILKIYGRFKTGNESQRLNVTAMRGPAGYTWSDIQLGNPNNNHVILTATLSKDAIFNSGTLGDLNITIQFGNTGTATDSVLTMRLDGFEYP